MKRKIIHVLFQLQMNYKSYHLEGESGLDSEAALFKCVNFPSKQRHIES